MCKCGNAEPGQYCGTAQIYILFGLAGQYIRHLHIKHQPSRIMFTKHEAAQLKQQFWTRFGQYMAPVPSAEGLKVNWVNYKTGVKDLFFKMQADTESATISIVMAHTDLSRQAIVFNHFIKAKNLLHDALQEEWQWQLHVPDEKNKIISRIYLSLTGVNILKAGDWPAIISFFKPRIIALDAFWTDVRFGFEAL